MLKQALLDALKEWPKLIELQAEMMEERANEEKMKAKKEFEAKKKAEDEQCELGAKTSTGSVVKEEQADEPDEQCELGAKTPTGSAEEAEEADEAATKEAEH